MDGRIILGKVDCTEERDLCKRDEHGNHDHESYYGDRNTDSLVQEMEHLVTPNDLESRKLSLNERYRQIKFSEEKKTPHHVKLDVELKGL
ncbi:thioredoxin-like fold protein [Artemisia annua]|uniref:Thioredoxin-like fold protein n=1 Tax=Artemisia annua TaxID=35608 RepID=A0A2U1KGZ8_ARTAN|nr:thioredoxin-like fold protein [Artemisia annua]